LDDEGEWFEHIFRTVQRITSNVTSVNHRTTKRNCKNIYFLLLLSISHLITNQCALEWHKRHTSNKNDLTKVFVFFFKGKTSFSLCAVTRLAGRNELEPGRLPGVQYIREAFGIGDGNVVHSLSSRARSARLRPKDSLYALSLSLYGNLRQ
jgi:hypothetical protein